MTSFIHFIIESINTNLTIAYTIIITLLAALITIRYSEIKTKKERFGKDYSSFKDAFAHASYQIKTGDTTLNLVIIGEYPIHHTAMSNFISHLKGVRRRRFEKKWNEYATHYYQLKSIGPAFMAVCTAILPSKDSPSDPESLDHYEKDRRTTILNIYHDLFEISNKKIWF